MYPTNNSAYLALSGIKLITKTMGQAETELSEGRVLMVMNSAGLIAPPVRGMSIHLASHRLLWQGTVSAGT